MKQLDTGDPAILLENRFSPMEAANALYATGSGEVPEAIVASLSEQVFGINVPRPSGRFRRWLAGFVLQVLKRTTRPQVNTGPDGQEVVVYRNAILEFSDHPYALTLLQPSHANSAAFVEGGDPMNAPYMMISPEIRQNACVWDRLFLDSVIGKDVQLRFIWETRITFEAARRRLKLGKPVSLKAAAAGTGLSMILVFDRLIREGFDPKLISATIADREAANVAKANRLLASLTTTSPNLTKSGDGFGISARIEDLLHPAPAHEHGTHADGSAPHLIVTLVGILEYFRGFTCATTEEFLGLADSGKEEEAKDVLRNISTMRAESITLITNSYRPATGARLLEVFGKRFHYRQLEDLHALAQTAGFNPIGTAGSGNIYDVEALEKRPLPDRPTT